MSGDGIAPQYRSKRAYDSTNKEVVHKNEAFALLKDPSNEGVFYLGPPRPKVKIPKARADLFTAQVEILKSAYSTYGTTKNTTNAKALSDAMESARKLLSKEDYEKALEKAKITLKKSEGANMYTDAEIRADVKKTIQEWFSKL